jgi:phenylalanyl-tRNA synthetase beta chain
VMTYALVAPRDHERIHVDDGDGHAIHVTNPVSVDHSVLRRMLLPGLLATLALNERVRRPDVAVFEIGETYRIDDEQPSETRRLGILLAGALWPAAWNRRAHPADVWDVRGYLELLLASLGAPAPRYEPREAVPGVEHPGRTAEALVRASDGEWLQAGVITELDPRVIEAFEGRADTVAYAELSLDAILAGVPAVRRARDLPRQPAVERDIAVVVPEAVPAAEVMDVIREAAGPALADLVVFDVYRGDPLGPAEKSFALRLRLEAEDPAAVDPLVEGIVAALATRGYQLRT